jgi:hypothetical protein
VFEEWTETGMYVLKLGTGVIEIIICALKHNIYTKTIGIINVLMPSKLHSCLKKY